MEHGKRLDGAKPAAKAQCLPPLTTEEKNKVMRDTDECLPPGTRAYRFHGIGSAEEVLNTENQAGQEYVVLSDIPESSINRIPETSPLSKLRSTYYPKSELLILKMPPKRPHESAIAEIDSMLVAKLMLMGAHQHLCSTGSADSQNRAKINALTDHISHERSRLEEQTNGQPLSLRLAFPSPISNWPEMQNGGGMILKATSNGIDCRRKVVRKRHHH
ncbi:hypothetical protein VTO42DRAFT_5546 [Malbranchea cinnamomea]